jgi:hypothetical protein
VKITVENEQEKQLLLNDSEMLKICVETNFFPERNSILVNLDKLPEENWIYDSSVKRRIKFSRKDADANGFTLHFRVNMAGNLPSPETSWVDRAKTIEFDGDHWLDYGDEEYVLAEMNFNSFKSRFELILNKNNIQYEMPEGEW